MAKVNEKTNCFAYKNDRYCIALTTMNCNGCKFFKTVEQNEKDLIKYPYDKSYAVSHK